MTEQATQYALKGCGLASLVMLMNSKGCGVGLTEANGYTGSSGGFTSAGDVLWNRMLDRFCAGVKYLHEESKDYVYPKFRRIDDVLKEINISEDIKNGYKYIVHVRNKYGQCGHFVYLIGVSDDCNSLTALDPAGQATEVSEICGYRKFR